MRDDLEIRDMLPGETAADFAGLRRSTILAWTRDPAALRPGDEIRIAWTEDGVSRSCWARVIDSWTVARGRFVRGRTTLGRVVTTHEHWITDVRAEHDDGVRASWAARYT